MEAINIRLKAVATSSKNLLGTRLLVARSYTRCWPSLFRLEAIATRKKKLLVTRASLATRSRDAPRWRPSY